MPLSTDWVLVQNNQLTNTLGLVVNTWNKEKPPKTRLNKQLLRLFQNVVFIYKLLIV